MMGPIARIVLRYGAGALFGVPVGMQLASDADVVAVVAVVIGGAVGVATEGAYALAKRWGWRT
ncbi:MAG: hypothetical protein CMK96_06200 [Pseudomonas sp.]|nr:hypothetical protein [Pseudomonas sp.]QDP67230.1 MAG: hypothetical protein GOVbin7368_21 [Prokaryotic dsDNA virus sp.]|tara:strand:+ start:31244 stop:31432 length:189 start_codon:yes stop_codon:yes gene_type:complete